MFCCRTDCYMFDLEGGGRDWHDELNKEFGLKTVGVAVVRPTVRHDAANALEGWGASSIQSGGARRTVGAMRSAFLLNQQTCRAHRSDCSFFVTRNMRRDSRPAIVRRTATGPFNHSVAARCRRDVMLVGSGVWLFPERESCLLFFVRVALSDRRGRII